MSVLVTGGAGFIGSHLAQRCATEGHAVRCVDSFEPYYAVALKELNAEDLIGSGVEVVRENLATTSVESLLEGVDTVFHFAAQPGISASTPFEDYLQNNLVATHRLLEAARASADLKLFVYVSTSSVYGRDVTGPETSEPKPTSFYGVTKLGAEQLTLSYQREMGLPACALRLFSVYGPRERPEKLFPQLIMNTLRQKPFHLYEGSDEHVRTFTYVGDVVDACLATMENTPRSLGKIFNIGSDEVHRVGDAIDLVGRILGQQPRIERVAKRAGDQLSTRADLTQTRELLGYDPRTTLEDGLRATVAWFQERVFPNEALHAAYER
ncbi:MAG: NAD-dependent epimerase/dehydratase family protein [bacterium]|nr:NAD-dependent epimerase/dehydratase family protein [bacterium]